MALIVHRRNVSPDDPFQNLKSCGDLKKANLALILNYIKKMHSAAGELSSWVSFEVSKNDDGKFERNLPMELKQDVHFVMLIKTKDVYYIRESHMRWIDWYWRWDLIAPINWKDETWSRKDYPKPEIVRREYRSSKSFYWLFTLSTLPGQILGIRKRTTMLVDRGFLLKIRLLGFAIVFPMVTIWKMPLLNMQSIIGWSMNSLKAKLL